MAAGAWMAGQRVCDNSQRLFLKYLSLFTDRADNDGIFPRNIPGKDPQTIIKTLSNFYANVVNYDLTRQWLLNDGPSSTTSIGYRSPIRSRKWPSGPRQGLNSSMVLIRTISRF